MGTEMQMPPLIIRGGQPPVIQMPPLVIGGGQPRPPRLPSGLRFEHVFVFPPERIDDPCGNVLMVANMWGFAVGSAELLPDHRAFLLKEVAQRMIENPAAGARMIGIASRSGSAQFNLDLGMRRAKNAKDELEFDLQPFELLNPSPPPPRVTIGSQGENFAARQGVADGSEQARHRAVLVTVLRDRRLPCQVTLRKAR